MKAFVVERYGKSGLHAAQAPDPTIGPRDVLVRVSAAGINPLDKMVRDGEFELLLKYKTPFVLGHDVAGVVTQVGADVRDYKVGDEVYWLSAAGIRPHVSIRRNARRDGICGTGTREGQDRRDHADFKDAIVLIPEAQIQSSEVREFAVEARAFLEDMRWCRSVPEMRLAFAIGGVLGIFEADIEAAEPGVDPIVWVVVGDLPPAYLYHEAGDKWQDALSGYCYEMQRWIDAVRSGDPLDDVIPVNVAPTTEHADMLASRLDFLQSPLVDVDSATLESDT